MNLNLCLFKNNNYGKSKYAIGIDVADKTAKSYCLMKLCNGNAEVIDCKTIYDKNEFDTVIDSIIAQYGAEFIIHQHFHPKHLQYKLFYQ